MATPAPNNPNPNPGPDPNTDRTGSAIDWDSWLLGIDWSQGWRRSRADLNQIPWPFLRRSTVDELARLFRIHDKLNRPNESPEMTPAHFEQLRRLDLHTTPTPKQPPPVYEWLGPTPGAPRPTIPRSKPDAPGAGFFTVGYQLDMPIAVYCRGGVFDDLPHPDDRRGDCSEIVSEITLPLQIKRIIIDKILTALNSQADVVAIRRDPEEGDIVHDALIERLRQVDEEREVSEGEPPVVNRDTPSPETQAQKEPPREEYIVDDVEAMSRKIASWCLLLNFRCSDPTREDEAFEIDESLLTATASKIEESVLAAPYAVSMAHTADGYSEGQKRAIQLLQLRAYQTKRDPNHIALEGMKPRYRAFSVYALDRPPYDMDSVRNEYYADPPEGQDVRDLYGWEVIRIASPVMPVEPANSVKTTAADICRVMRAGFRIHRDMTAIPTTMQVTVSHTKGFTLLEVKKILSLYAVMEEPLRGLNRRFRGSLAYQDICGSIRRYSPLGVVSLQNPEENFDPDKILPTDRRDDFMAEMDAYMPTDLLAYGEGVSQEDQIFFVSLWNYDNITALCKAATSANPSHKTSLVALCRGGDYTEPTELTADEEYEAANAGLANASYNVTDAARGVFKFRGSAHSMDPAHITSWAGVCSAIVNFAKTADPATFRSVVTSIAQGGTGLLNLIGVSEDIQAWYISRVRPSVGFLLDDVVDKISWTDPFYADLSPPPNSPARAPSFKAKGKGRAARFAPYRR
ncbi:hypothetical protein Hte_012357 [Hypoxylon texense]